ncbi:uncharacterized protein L203_106414 [Cryptococcus depauperatus CBS 7841]|uniref:Uncharacterized protein n=1 Tax=Cryptococcus depauperatus CBS 7841 TaxID=1295531 RepID=A0A1E3IKV5_9TREE|nr:hypothetical protein L203_02582 [Cryptococcus depauperatus CBS 7841]
MTPSDQDINQFRGITHATEDQARHFLQSSNNVETAVEDYYAAQNANNEQEITSIVENDEDYTNATHVKPAGGYILSGQPVQETLPLGWGQPERSRFGRIHQGDDHGHDDDDENKRRKPEELFAGGGKNSGLAVENPNHGDSNPLIDRLLRAAQSNTSPPQSSTIRPLNAGPSNSPEWFTGGGHTLGDDETPSEQIQSENASSSAGATGIRTGEGMTESSSNIFNQLMASMLGSSSSGQNQARDQSQGQSQGQPLRSALNAPPSLSDFPPSRVSTSPTTGETIIHRTLHLWRNGFSIEDGPLLSYTTPENRALLQAMEEGRAPSVAFGVPFNTRCNVDIEEKRDRDYESPKKVLRPFGGGGQRLGSAPPPGEAVSNSESRGSEMPGALPSTTTETTSQLQPTTPSFDVDPSQPTTSIQIRFADGSRQVAKFNLSHTLADLYAYVSSAQTDRRAFVLQTTFPPKELRKDSEESVENAGLKNSVVVQRFT